MIERIKCTRKAEKRLKRLKISLKKIKIKLNFIKNKNQILIKIIREHFIGFSYVKIRFICILNFYLCLYYKLFKLAAKMKKEYIKKLNYLIRIKQ